jgi:hypothetical protein
VPKFLDVAALDSLQGSCENDVYLQAYFNLKVVTLICQQVAVCLCFLMLQPWSKSKVRACVVASSNLVLNFLKFTLWPEVAASCEL